MRTLTLGFLAATALGGISTAAAADLDYDYLRGPEYEPVSTQIIDWSGLYVGGHGGYSSGAYGFNNNFSTIGEDTIRRSLNTYSISEYSALSVNNARKGGSTYGAFAGYNMQFDEGVIGVEFDYTRFDIAGISRDRVSQAQFLPDGTVIIGSLYGTSKTKLVDIGTVRARAGYAIDAFLPYVTGGFAVGRARIGDTISLIAPSLDAEYFGQTKTKVVGGFTLGAGVEYAITSNILLRGEYQYVLLNDFDGHKVNINTVRGGAAYKF